MSGQTESPKPWNMSLVGAGRTLWHGASTACGETPTTGLDSVWT